MSLAPLLTLLCLVAQEPRSWVTVRGKKTFDSVDGRRELEVRPGEVQGFVWTLKGAGGVEWEMVRPHSASRAWVCADGTVVAHGADDPKASWQEKSTALTILAPDGAGRMLELWPFRSAVGGGGAYPRPEIMLVWETLDTCAFWMEEWGDRDDRIVVFSLSTGARKHVFEPEQEIEPLLERRTECSATSVTSLGPNELVLITFRGADRELRNSAVALFTLDGRLAWRHEEAGPGWFENASVVVGTESEVRCRVDLCVATEFGRGAKGKQLVKTVPIHLRRDESGAWREAPE